MGRLMINLIPELHRPMGRWGMDMPQLTRPLPRVRGPKRLTPFKAGQRVIVSNDMVYLNAIVLTPNYNIHYNEITRLAEWGCEIEIAEQEGCEQFYWDIMNCNRSVSVCYNHGIWMATVHSAYKRPTLINMLVQEQ